MAGRAEVLRSILETKPEDSFARYGLAMEYAKTGDLERAASEYSALLAADPDYAAAYFHGGQVLEKLGRIEEARDAGQSPQSLQGPPPALEGGGIQRHDPRRRGNPLQRVENQLQRSEIAQQDGHDGCRDPGDGTQVE